MDAVRARRSDDYNGESKGGKGYSRGYGRYGKGIEKGTGYGTASARGCGRAQEASSSADVWGRWKPSPPPTTTYT